MFGSLFEFAKDVGTRLFTSDAEAAMSILKHIEANNPGASPLHAEYDSGCVTLSGSTESVAAKKNACSWPATFVVSRKSSPTTCESPSQKN